MGTQLLGSPVLQLSEERHSRLDQSGAARLSANSIPGKGDLGTARGQPSGGEANDRGGVN